MKQYDFSHFEAAKNFIKIKLYYTHTHKQIHIQFLSYNLNNFVIFKLYYTKNN